MPLILHGDARKFGRFPAYADRLLSDAVSDGTEFGARRMAEIVPRSSGDLAGAVYGEATIIGPGHHRGVVGVNEALAPHAGMVNRGTGIQGPFATPVTITRPSRKNPSKPGAMQFFKNGEGRGDGVYRARVKFRPSSKIERGKNFLGKTYDSMVVWTHVRVAEIGTQIIGYFSRRS